MFRFSYYCPMNIESTEDEVRISFRATGLKKEDISVKVEPNTLVIKTAVNEDADKRDMLREEFWRDNINTRLSLPADIDNEGLTAKVEDGILIITLPKTKSASREIMVA